MDSFCSLFDPGEEKPHNSSKKSRRKSLCKSPRKNAHLPDESSFLCEPQLTNDVLVKDISYLDHYIAIDQGLNKDVDNRNNRMIDTNSNFNQHDYKNVSDNMKSKKRNRRKRCKLSKEKQFFDDQNSDPLVAKEENEHKLNDFFSQKNSNLNNSKYWDTKDKVLDKNEVGRNVNSWRKDGKIEWDFNKKTKRKPLVGNDEICTEVVDLATTSSAQTNNDWDKMEMDELLKSSEDELLSSLDEEDLTHDEDGEFVEEDEDYDETDSGDEIYGRLPPEPQLGNVEYKLKLIEPSKQRFQHLVTQLKWRLISGGGTAVYEVGVRDCGALRGLRARDMRGSLRTLRRMSSVLGAKVAAVIARRVAPHRAVAEVVLRKIADNSQSIELRVAVTGANDAGKSTLVGVLTQGELDNGRGSARLNMFRHLHEVRSGRTSSLSHEILGFDAQGRVVNYGCSELMTAERIGERSSKLVAFLDLAGHAKYQRTTIHGLTGYAPHYALLLVSATAGFSSMTEEHLALVLALELPLALVVTKLDLAPHALDELVTKFSQMLLQAQCKKTPMLIHTEQEAILASRLVCAASGSLLADSLLERTWKQTVEQASSTPDKNELRDVIPVFSVSCVSGFGLNSLHSFLLGLAPPEHVQCDPNIDLNEESVEFQVDEIFRVGENAGPVVGGLLARGILQEGSTLLIGPLETGDFVPITVNSIYRNRVPCGIVKSGQSASLGLSKELPKLRQGMVLLSIPENYNPDRCNVKKNLDRRKNHSKIVISDDELNTDCIISEKVDSVAEQHSNIDKKCVNVDAKNDNYLKLTEECVKSVTNYEKNVRSLKNLNDNKEKLISLSVEINDNCLRKKENIDEKTDTFDEKINNYAKLTEECTNIDKKIEISKNLDKKTILTKKNNLFDDTNCNMEQKLRMNIPKNYLLRNDTNLKNNTENFLLSVDDIMVDGDNKVECGSNSSEVDVEECGGSEDACSSSVSDDELLLEDPDDPRGCLFFQATVRVLRHSTAIYPGFQATVHIGNIRQTAIIEGIMSYNNVLRAGNTASALFRFVRTPEYVRAGRRMLFRAGHDTRGVGNVTQVFPYRI